MADRYQIEQLRESHYDQFRRAFLRVWPEDNVLYSALAVTPDELAPYVDILLDRARLQPHTITVGLAVSDDCPQGQVAAFVVMRDLFDDPIERRRYDSLSPSIRTILAFNADIVGKLFANPLFEQYLHTPRTVCYGLHMGAVKEHLGSGLLRDMVRFVNEQLARDGWRAWMGVSTHERTVQASFDKLELGSSVVFAVGKWSWSPGAGVPPPFRHVASPPFAVGSFTLLPSLFSPSPRL